MSFALKKIANFISKVAFVGLKCSFMMAAVFTNKISLNSSANHETS